MRPCSEVIALLVDYLERQLPPAVQEDLERHLARCPRCVCSVKSYERTVTLLRSLTERDLPDDLRLSLRAFLDRQAQN